jgi:proprotein convertase subtilisin/kexin type 5
MNSEDSIPCKHDSVEFNPEVVDVDEEFLLSDDARILAGSTATGPGSTTPKYPNIRIHPHYDSITVGTDEFKNYIKDELLPPVISLLQSALMIKYPLTSPLKITQTKVCSLDTPAILNVTGANADFFIFFTATTDTSSSWVASASNCLVTSGIKRPLVAKVLLNTYAIKPVTEASNPRGHEYNMYVLMHEIFHALGFSVNFWYNYVDDLGNPLKNHVKKVLLSGTNRTVLDFPVLTQRLRNFYGCPTLEGAFMEDDGGSGTASSHWERKFFPFDLLSSGAIHGRRITEFTLAFLEGTGWYAANYSYAEPFHFGQGQGCDFIYRTCDAKNTGGFEEFCVGTGRECTEIGRGGGFCKTDECSDGCRFVVPQSEYDCENPDGVYYSPYASKQVYGRGLGSKCFSGNLSTTAAAVSQKTYCFKYNCTGTGVNTQLEVAFGTTKLLCTQKGKIAVKGYYGFINCPDPIQYCNTIGKSYCPRGCSGRGKCVDNKCVCNSGFSGIDCAFRKTATT